VDLTAREGEQEGEEEKEEERDPDPSDEEFSMLQGDAAWWSRNGYIQLHRRDATHAGPRELRCLAKACEVKILLDYGPGTPINCAGGEQFKEELHMRLVRGHYTRVAQKGSGAAAEKVVNVRGQGACAYLVAATHTKADRLLWCQRKDGVPTGHNADAKINLENEEARRLRALTCDLLQHKDEWRAIPNTGKLSDFE
jgi:hypothetical protein